MDSRDWQAAIGTTYDSLLAPATSVLTHSPFLPRVVGLDTRKLANGSVILAAAGISAVPYCNFHTTEDGICQPSTFHLPFAQSDETALRLAYDPASFQRHTIRQLQHPSATAEGYVHLHRV